MARELVRWTFGNGSRFRISFSKEIVFVTNSSFDTKQMHMNGITLPSPINIVVANNVWYFQLGHKDLWSQQTEFQSTHWEKKHHYSFDYLTTWTTSQIDRPCAPEFSSSDWSISSSSSQVSPIPSFLFVAIILIYLPLPLPLVYECIVIVAPTV